MAKAEGRLSDVGQKPESSSCLRKALQKTDERIEMAEEAESNGKGWARLPFIGAPWRRGGALMKDQL